jgi:hypothetical protein
MCFGILIILLILNTHRGIGRAYDRDNAQVWDIFQIVSYYLRGLGDIKLLMNLEYSVRTVHQDGRYPTRNGVRRGELSIPAILLTSYPPSVSPAACSGRVGNQLSVVETMQDRGVILGYPYPARMRPGYHSPNLVYRLGEELVLRYINCLQRLHQCMYNLIMYIVRCHNVPCGIHLITATDLIVVPERTGSSVPNFTMSFIPGYKHPGLILPKVAWGQTPRTLQWCRDQDVCGLRDPYYDTGSYIIKYPSSNFSLHREKCWFIPVGDLSVPCDLSTRSGGLEIDCGTVKEAIGCTTTRSICIVVHYG